MPDRLARLCCALLLALPWRPLLAADLTVSAAASLTQAFRALAPVFEAAHPGTKVLLNFGASGALLAQIAKGAPVDVFASADRETMDQAVAQRLVDAPDRRDFVSNRLVLVVPASSSRAPAALADLADPGFARVAIGQPASVPAGRYARAALEKAGLWTSVAPRTIAAQSVRQALDYVARGEVDAAFVYATDAAIAPDRVRIAFAVPTDVPIRYPIAALAKARHRAEAARFVDFVASDAARAVLAKHGFGAP